MVCNNTILEKEGLVCLMSEVLSDRKTNQLSESYYSDIQSVGFLKWCVEMKT